MPGDHTPSIPNALQNYFHAAVPDTLLLPAPLQACVCSPGPVCPLYDCPNSLIVSASESLAGTCLQFSFLASIFQVRYSVVKSAVPSVPSSSVSIWIIT